MRHELAAAIVLLAAGAAAQETRSLVMPQWGPRPIFDGRTLDGWVTKGGRYDGNAAWTVEDGAICGRQGPDRAGGLLYTARPYACFTLSLDVWMTRPNDSGIFVRMAPEERGAQVTLDDRDDGEVGAVYSDGFLAHNATARAKWKPEAWNKVTVRCTGRDMRIEAWIDGEKVTDHQIPPGTSGFAPTGLIGLQVHGGRDDPPGTVVKFRAITIVELPVFDNADFTADEMGRMTPTDVGARKGWKLLSDGFGFDGWVNEGFWPEPLVIRPSGHASTQADYRDFDLHLDFRIDREGANSGVFLRASRDDPNLAFSGCEVQILDDANWERVHHAKLEPWQLCGSIYGSSPPKVRGVVAPVGSWNTYRILYEGSRLRVELNGVLVQDVDVMTLPVPEGQKPFEARRKSGVIGLQRHDMYGAVRFRNIFVRPIP